jgi:cysteine synthase B
MSVLETLIQTPSAPRRSLLEMIGNTPLLSFDRITQAVAPVRVLAKAEWYNPGGSVKDRPARGMILDGEKRGLLNRDKTLIDASSGNTGIAYAMICASRPPMRPKNAKKSSWPTARNWF